MFFTHEIWINCIACNGGNERDPKRLHAFRNLEVFKIMASSLLTHLITGLTLMNTDLLKEFPAALLYILDGQIRIHMHVQNVSNIIHFNNQLTTKMMRRKETLSKKNRPELLKTNYGLLRYKIKQIIKYT